jgi:hypothetical protein
MRPVDLDAYGGHGLQLGGSYASPGLAETPFITSVRGSCCKARVSMAGMLTVGAALTGREIA